MPVYSFDQASVQCFCGGSLRADAINVLNKPIWGTPNLNIHSTSFGQIAGANGRAASI
jgi:hypothetical protein